MSMDGLVEVRRGLTVPDRSTSGNQPARRTLNVCHTLNESCGVTPSAQAARRGAHFTGQAHFAKGNEALGQRLAAQ